MNKGIGYIIEAAKRIICMMFIAGIIGSMILFASASDQSRYTARDARKVLRMASGLESPDNSIDVNADNRVTTEDARIILRRAARLPDYKPETTQITTTEPATEPEYFQIGVLSTCGLSEAQLTNGLRKSLKTYAWAFLEAERTYNVNAVFLSAVAAFESGWGESSIARNRNNLFGWTGNGGYRYFDSVPECIMYVAKHLRTNYLTPGGSCFHGYEVEDIAVSYCPGGYWSGQVKSIMRMIQSDAG